MTQKRKDYDKSKELAQIPHIHSYCTNYLQYSSNCNLLHKATFEADKQRPSGNHWNAGIQ